MRLEKCHRLHFWQMIRLDGLFPRRVYHPVRHLSPGRSPREATLATRQIFTVIRPFVGSAGYGSNLSGGVDPGPNHAETILVNSLLLRIAITVRGQIVSPQSVFLVPDPRISHPRLGLFRSTIARRRIVGEG